MKPGNLTFPEGPDQKVPTTANHQQRQKAIRGEQVKNAHTERVHAPQETGSGENRQLQNLKSFPKSRIQNPVSPCPSQKDPGWHGHPHKSESSRRNIKSTKPALTWHYSALHRPRPERRTQTKWVRKRFYRFVELIPTPAMPRQFMDDRAGHASEPHLNLSCDSISFLVTMFLTLALLPGTSPFLEGDGKNLRAF